MHTEIEVKDTIDDAITASKNVLDTLDEVSSKLTTIGKNLSVANWSGEAYQKCKSVHQAIVAYEKAIHPLCEQLKANIEQLQTDEAAFYEASENVASIKSM